MISSQALKTLFFGLLLMLAVSASSNAAVAMEDPMDAIPEDNIGGSRMSLDAIPEDITGGLEIPRFLRGTTEDQGHRELGCKHQSGVCFYNHDCCSRVCKMLFCYGSEPPN